MLGPVNPWLHVAKEFGEAFPGRPIAPRVFEELSEEEQILAMRKAIDTGKFPEGWEMPRLPPGCIV